MTTLSFGAQMNAILHNPVTIIFVLAVLDIGTGIAKSIINHTYKSNIFKKGLFTHIAIVVGLYLFQFYAGDFNLEPLLLPIATAFALMYISSLYENYKEMGGETPKYVDKLLSEVKEKEEGNADATVSDETEK